MRLWKGYRDSIIASLLLAIISAYYINSTMFSHVHVIDGATIVHSHLFGEGHDEQGGDGEHTAHEITLIQHLNNIVVLKAETLHLESVSCECEYELYVPSSQCTPEIYVESWSEPRAPPCFFV